jgi:hypothetical protein
MAHLNNYLTNELNIIHTLTHLPLYLHFPCPSIYPPMRHIFLHKHLPTNTFTHVWIYSSTQSSVPPFCVYVKYVCTSVHVQKNLHRNIRNYFCRSCRYESDGEYTFPFFLLYFSSISPPFCHSSLPLSSSP